MASTDCGTTSSKADALSCGPCVGCTTQWPTKRSSCPRAACGKWPTTVTMLPPALAPARSPRDSTIKHLSPPRKYSDGNLISALLHHCSWLGAAPIDSVTAQAEMANWCRLADVVGSGGVMQRAPLAGVAPWAPACCCCCGGGWPVACTAVMRSTV